MTNPGHNLPAPDPRPVAQVLRRFFARMRGEYVKRFAVWVARGGVGRPPDLNAYLPAMVATLKPVMAGYWKQGINRAAKSILAQVQRRHPVTRHVSKGLACYIVKDVSLPIPSLELSFDLFNQRILQAVENATFDFCAATVDTITNDVGLWWREALRGELGDALRRGEGTGEINRRVGAIFDDPYRAARVAQTETSRGVHLGGRLAAKESGIVDKKFWIVSLDACDLCLSLGAKGPIPMDEPYHVNPKGGPYAVTQHPPVHPHDMCTEGHLVNFNLVEAGIHGPMPGLAIRERLGQLVEVL